MTQPTEPEYLAAAKRRKRIPLWAVPIFPALIVWAIIYVNAVQKPPAGANDPIAMGGEIYAANCASCHGGSGGGGVGPAFTGKALDKVFPDYTEQLAWVNIGSSAWPNDTFGAEGSKPARSGATMPGFGPDGSKALTCEQIALVVRYERETLGGGAPDEKLVALTEQIAEAGGQPLAQPVDCKTIPKP